MSSSLINPADFASTFIVKPSSLGDIVHTLPAVHLLKQAYPQLNLRWICNTEWMPLLEGNPDLTDIIPFPRQEFKGAQGIAKFLLWSRRLNATARNLPEFTIDFQGLLRSALICKARGTEPVIGFSNSREGASLLYNHIIPVNPAAHAVDRYLEAIRALGISVDPEKLKFPLPQGVEPKGINLPANFLLLHPYSRGEGKSLTQEALQTICDCLSPRSIVIVGKCANPHQISGPHVTSLINQTNLSELIWLTRKANACVSVDSGPMHIAAAITDRTLGIHTWSNPRQVGPYNSKAWIWKAGRIAHRPEFSDEEVQQHVEVVSSDARRIADFILLHWYS